VGRVAIGVGPLVFSREEFGRARQLFGGDQAFERRQPVLVIVRAVVGFSAIRRRLQFTGKCGCPFFPGEMALFGKSHGEGEGLGLPWLGEDGTPSSRGSRGKSDRRSELEIRSGSLKVVIPHVDMNRIAQW
jgi:hypothetical protein